MGRPFLEQPRPFLKISGRRAAFVLYVYDEPSYFLNNKEGRKVDKEGMKVTINSARIRGI